MAKLRKMTYGYFFSDFGLNCAEYTSVVFNAFSALPYQGQTSSSWKITPISNSPKYGISNFVDYTAAALHSYVLVEYKGRGIVFDPWPTNRPDIYEFSEYKNVWPIP